MIVTPATEAALHERVLLLGDGGDRAVRPTLAEAGLHTDVCDDLEALCACIAQGAGAAVVPEEALAGEALARFRDALAAQPRWSDLPVIVLGSGEAGAGWDLIAALEPAGNAVLLERPL